MRFFAEIRGQSNLLIVVEIISVFDGQVKNTDWYEVEYQIDGSRTYVRGDELLNIYYQEIS